MTTAVDTNVIVGLWDRDPILSAAAQRALDAALDRGPLAAAAPVFAELMAAPGRDAAFLDVFFQRTGIRVDCGISARVSGEPPDKPSNPVRAAAAERARPARGAFSPTLSSELMPL
jgi:hypothetical protein